MSNQKIKKLAEKRKQLDQQIKELRDRQRIFTGGLLLQHIEQNPDSTLSREWLIYLNVKTTRTKDRELMGLGSSLPVEQQH